MRHNSIKKLVLICSLLLAISCFILPEKTAVATPTAIYAGSITIHGPTTDPTVKCTPVTNPIVRVGPNGNTITFQVNYTMDAPTALDQASCDISFSDGGATDSRQTSGSDTGFMTISKLMMPGDTFSIRLHAKYTDYLGTLVLGEDTEYTTGTVVSVPKPIASFSFTPLIPIQGDPVQFTDLSTTSNTSILIWIWNFGDGLSSTLRNPTHIYQSGGMYTVTLQVTDDYGQTASATHNISINEKPIADFIYTPAAPTTGDKIQFTDTSTDPDGTIASWLWNFGDGSTESIGKNPTYQYAKAGTYNVSLQVTDNNGATDLKTISLTIKEQGIPGFELYLALCAVALLFFWYQKSKR